MAEEPAKRALIEEIEACIERGRRHLAKAETPRGILGLWVGNVRRLLIQLFGDVEYVRNLLPLPPEGLPRDQVRIQWERQLAQTSEFVVRARRALEAAYSNDLRGSVFFGHGRSLIWREFKDFVNDRLKLPWQEFNRDPTAGVMTFARLREMMDGSSFAFLVMTAEDEQTDGTKHARENVIHEVGLFQAHLGEHRAIILLEDGCREFTNIAGLGQIRFPAGQARSAFEEMRKVLEREGMVKS